VNTRPQPCGRGLVILQHDADSQMKRQNGHFRSTGRTFFPDLFGFRFYALRNFNRNRDRNTMGRVMKNVYIGG
jgi:hypothetical protein